MNTVLNWSSGKDAAMAYHLLQGSAYKVRQLLTTISDANNRIVMHGVRESLLDIQAEKMHLPLNKVYLPSVPDDTAYNKAMADILQSLREQGIHYAAFGDIFLEDLKKYREAQLAGVGFEAIFPLWGADTNLLVPQIEDAGIEAIVVCVNEKYLGKEFLGRRIGRGFLNDLPAGVDACGENGEFHTFVSNAPYFSSPIPVQAGDIVYKKYEGTNGQTWDTGFYFLDIQPA